MTQLLLQVTSEKDGPHPVLIRPYDERDKVLFAHVAGKLSAVTPSHWSSTVKPLVEAHGWDWEIEDKENLL